MSSWLADFLRRLAHRIDGTVLSPVPALIVEAIRANPECELVINYSVVSVEGVEVFVQQDPGGTQ
jgi:hypothetical protein